MFRIVLFEIILRYGATPYDICAIEIQVLLPASTRACSISLFTIFLLHVGFTAAQAPPARRYSPPSASSTLDGSSDFRQRCATSMRACCGGIFALGRDFSADRSASAYRYARQPAFSYHLRRRHGGDVLFSCWPPIDMPRIPQSFFI